MKMTISVFIGAAVLSVAFLAPSATASATYGASLEKPFMQCRLTDPMQLRSISAECAEVSVPESDAEGVCHSRSRSFVRRRRGTNCYSFVLTDSDCSVTGVRAAAGSAPDQTQCQGRQCQGRQCQGQQRQGHFGEQSTPTRTCSESARACHTWQPVHSKGTQLGFHRACP